METCLVPRNFHANLSPKLTQYIDIKDGFLSNNFVSYTIHMGHRLEEVDAH